MKKLLCALVFLLGMGMAFNRIQGQPLNTFHLDSIAAQKVGISFNKMTNLIFPYAIQTGIKVSRDLIVQKVKGVNNVIELKAARKDFAPTNLSVFGFDGRLYSFDVQYEDNPGAYNYQIIAADKPGDLPPIQSETAIQFSGFPVSPAELEVTSDSLSRMGFLHHSTRNERMKLTLRGLYLKDSLLWVVCRVKNDSYIPYQEDYFRIFSSDRKKIKRSAIQQTTMTPIVGPHLSAVPGGGHKYYALGFLPFTISKHQDLYFEIAEHNGGRSLFLKISHKTILKARVLK